MKLARIVLIACASLAAYGQAQGQAQGQTPAQSTGPTFDVASIKPAVMPTIWMK